MKGNEARFKELGLKLPALPPALGAYIPAVRAGKLIFCSGQGTYRDGALQYIGRVGAQVSLEEAYQAARLAGLNCLAEICTLTGSLDGIRRIVKITGFVNSAPDFHDQPKVVNGASELMLQIFGEQGKHARSAIGTSNLPGNICVEVEMVVEAEE